jgi:hypothetical protein
MDENWTFGFYSSLYTEGGAIPDVLDIVIVKDIVQPVHLSVC